MRPGHGGFTLVGGKPTRLVSAYAPSDGSKSSDSMTKTLEPYETPVLFIDAKCVGTHPDRVPHTGIFFPQALLGGFSCVLLFSSLLRS